jgi:hypothetical protein
MTFSPLAFMELFVVLAFAVGWLILEFVAKQLDKRRADDDLKATEDETSTTSEGEEKRR